MFTQYLDSEQQRVFLDLLLKIIQADGLISSEEQEKMNLYKSIFPDIIPKELPLEELASVFHTHKAKSSVLLELLAVAMADGTVHKPEQAFLNEITSALCVSEQEMAKMVSWVSRMTKLVHESQTFMKD